MENPWFLLGFRFSQAIRWDGCLYSTSSRLDGMSTVPRYPKHTGERSASINIDSMFVCDRLEYFFARTTICFWHSNPINVHILCSGKPEVRCFRMEILFGLNWLLMFFEQSRKNHGKTMDNLSFPPSNSEFLAKKTWPCLSRPFWKRSRHFGGSIWFTCHLRKSCHGTTRSKQRQRPRVKRWWVQRVMLAAGTRDTKPNTTWDCKDGNVLMLDLCLKVRNTGNRWELFYCRISVFVWKTNITRIH